ncbi:unnamed protein product [Linum trigynum]|uniref:Uncharacterized protein n=1 Tax=Linum trigynum TaxID=586398 RepID=A0AAV2GCZ5_9ROSI
MRRCGPVTRTASPMEDELSRALLGEEESYNGGEGSATDVGSFPFATGDQVTSPESRTTLESPLALAAPTEIMKDRADSPEFRVAREAPPALAAPIGEATTDQKSAQQASVHLPGLHSNRQLGN